MSKLIFRFYVFFLFATFTGLSVTSGQSTHDLEPPAQQEQLAPASFIKGVTAPQRNFQFASAELDKNGNVVLITKDAIRNTTLNLPKSSPKLKTGQSTKVVTEEVVQNYTVSVPYTEVVDGERRQRIRSETRTRNVKVQKTIVVDAMGEKVDPSEIEKEKTEPHFETYSISVPYQEFVDGKAVTRFRTEARSRTVDLPVGYKQKEQLVLTKKMYDPDKVTFYDVDGEEIPAKELADRLSDRQPVILISHKSSIDPYFSHLLNPKAIFIVASKSGLKATESEPMEKVEKK